MEGYGKKYIPKLSQFVTITNSGGNSLVDLVLKKNFEF